MKGHNVIFILLTLVILSVALTAAAAALSGCGETDSPRTATAPEGSPQDTQIYFTANSGTSQESAAEKPAVSADSSADTRETASDTASKTDEKTAQDGYILRTYHGKIGVFAGDDTTPLRTENISVSSLPESDQTKLADGIPVKNKDELRRVLEDFE